MQFLWKYIDDLVGKGLDFFQIIQLMFYALARFVPIALPISILLASVMTIGKMGENFELTALQASGISNSKIFKPLFLLVIMLGIST
jgi:lipopolysaccharide export system permease protein